MNAHHHCSLPATSRTPSGQGGGSVSVVMINRNGGAHLSQALADLCHAFREAHRQAPQADVEFVFVDNGSTDDSLPRARQAMSDSPYPLRVVEEPLPGVNSARRAGVSHSRGRYLIFTDNDLRFSPGWLTAYLRAFEGDDSPRIFGGRVLVGEIEGAVPNWLALTGPLARTPIVVQCDNGEQPLDARLDDPSHQGPVGPNMAFERSVFQQYGTFDLRFGLRPGSLVPGAEAEFFHRLGKHAERWQYVPEACVRHPLKQSQLTRAYFRRRMAGVGRVAARLQYLDQVPATRLFGVKRYLFKQLAAAWVRYLGAVLTQPADRRFYQRCEVSVIVGQIMEDLASRAPGYLEQHEAPASGDGAESLASPAMTSCGSDGP